MTVSTPCDSPPELAQRLLDGEVLPPASLGSDGWRALAWTLKDLCYSAWSSEPQRAVRAADVLRDLCGARHGSWSAIEPAASVAVASEIEALAGWTTGIAQLTRGEMLAATESFDHAARLFAQLGQARHATQTQVPKIMALSMLGQHDRAIACAETTQAEFISQGDVRAASKVCLNLGSLHLGRDAYASAARHYREAAVLFARVADHEHSVMADIGLADALTSLGDFDEALLIFARARMRAGTHGFPVLEAMVEESCALLHLARGAYREALGGLERARRGYESLAMPQHLAIAEKQLADAYLELRLLPEAMALYEQAVSRFEALDAPVELAWALAQAGRAQALMHFPARASESLRRAGELFDAQGAEVGSASVALVRCELALAGADAHAALAFADASMQAFAHAGMAERRSRAEVLRAKAMLALGQNDVAAAQFDAVERRARELGLLTIRIQCLTGRGLATLARGQPEPARLDFEAAIDLFEEQRRVLPGDEFQRAFLHDHLRPYQEMLRLALDAHARSGLDADARKVLEWQERYRARALGERLSRADDAESDAADQAQRVRLNWLYRRVQQLQDDAAPVGGLSEEIRRAENDLLERSRRGRLSSGAARGADVGPGPISGGSDAFDARALCQVMREHEALVEYGVLDDELFASVVTHDGVQVRRRLARWPDVVEAVRSARFQIESLRSGQAPLARHLDTLTSRALARLQRVRELVWAPLAPALTLTRRLLVVPHGPLGSLPFAALLDDGRNSATTVELAVVPSARVALHGLRSQPRTARTALVFGESTRLQHAADEARDVARLFPDARCFVGPAATLATLQSLAPHADVIHFACHAQFRADNPMFSALHLHDGALTVDVAQALRLSQSTVVLSACETALADQGSGDEMVGLVRAFLVAGAARIVASLWPVDDRITAHFMTCFYAALARDIAPAAALREAQAEVRRDHPHPGHWAAFTLFGGW